MSEQGTVIGVDVGGTFTDLVMIDHQSGGVQVAKVPSTLDNQAHGVMNAVDTALVDLATVVLIVHGTTTTTNAVLERKLSKTGLITTQGFRDILELGRRTRPQAYGMKGVFTPIIPRPLRHEVPERMDAQGRVVTPLDADAVRDAAQNLLDQGCESVVIHFLHAYANPTHERAAAEIVRTVWPNDHITLGHALLSESREFERGVTAAVNASVQPLLARYVKKLDQALSDGGYTGDLLVMNGNGGMVSAARVADEAAKTVMSGPASGVMAAAYAGRASGLENLITYDMGGTSTDVALIRDAQPSVSNETEIEYAMPIHVPMVDVRTVGAGGGSIARVNAGGLLEVGPDSAGADPGPICYGRGGTEPTISDANLLLGRIDPDRLTGVDGGVSFDEVKATFQKTIGDPLGLDATQAAAAVIRMANTKMAGAIRMVSVSLGADPRDFALFAFGGAGPLHASALAKELGIPTVMVPPRPGITNAIGCVVADLRQDFVRTLNQPLDTLALDTLRAVLADQGDTGTQMVQSQGLPLRGIEQIHSLDMQFVGQTHLIRVPLDGVELSQIALRAAFDQVYFRRFRVDLPDTRVSVVNVNTSVIGRRPDLDLGSLIDPSNRGDLADAQRTKRPVHFETWHDTPVYLRDRLPLDVELKGPAVLEQMDTTILLEPGDIARGDKDGNLLVEVTS